VAGVDLGDQFVEHRHATTRTGYTQARPVAVVTSDLVDPSFALLVIDSTDHPPSTTKIAGATRASQDEKLSVIHGNLHVLPPGSAGLVARRSLHSAHELATVP